jgi:hypothetical protein
MRQPVLRLAREPVSTLEQEDLLAGGREVSRKRPAARPVPMMMTS